MSKVIDMSARPKDKPKGKAGNIKLFWSEEGKRKAERFKVLDWGISDDFSILTLWLAGVDGGPMRERHRRITEYIGWDYDPAEGA